MNGKNMGSLRRISRGVLFLMILSLAAAPGEDTALTPVSPDGKEAIPGRYWYFVENIKAAKGREAEVRLWVSLPLTRPGQAITIGKIYPKPAAVVRDTTGRNMFVFWRRNIPAGIKRVLFYYDLDVIPEEMKREIDPQVLLPYDRTSPDYIRFTRAEPWIEVTPETRETALRIVAGETNPFFQARMLFDWMLENMKYETSNYEDRGALKTLKTLKGDCAEYSVLYACLARSLGIPARTVTCLWLSGSGHYWNEILLPPHGWVPVDTTIAHMMTPGYSFLPESELRDYLKKRSMIDKKPGYLFGNSCPGSLIVAVGNNIEIPAVPGGGRMTFEMIQPGGAAAVPPAIKFRGLAGMPVHGGFYVFGDKRGDITLARKKAYRELAPAYFNAGLRDEAETRYRELLVSNPEDASILLNMGHICMGRREYGKAVEFLTRAVEGRGGCMKPVLEAWARNLRGDCYARMENAGLAEKDYRWVIDRNISYNNAAQYAVKHLRMLKGAPKN